MSEKTFKDLIHIRKVLKNKFRAVRMGGESAERKLEKTFFPITYPLKELLKTSKSSNIFVKKEKEESQNTPSSSKKFMKIETSTPLKKLNEKTHDSEISDDDTIQDFNQSEQKVLSEEETYESADEDMNESKILTDLNFLEQNGLLDKTYGPHKDARGNWRFGNSTLEINSNKMKIGDSLWSTTPGLIQLLFHKSPKDYDSTEMSIYKKILLKTNAYRQNFSPDGRLKGTSSNKYRNIIKPLLSLPGYAHEGSGLMTLIPSKPNYIYWDDPNELVERLRLLISSQSAGHNNHTNEITSIIEELKEANIIV